MEQKNLHRSEIIELMDRMMNGYCGEDDGGCNLSEMLGLQDVETRLLACLVARSAERCVTFGQLAYMLGCKPLEMISILPGLDRLASLHYIQRWRDNGEVVYRVSDEALMSIMEGKPYSYVCREIVTQNDFYHESFVLFKMLRKGLMLDVDFEREFRCLMQRGVHLPLSHFLEGRRDFGYVETVVLAYVCTRYFVLNADENRLEELTGLFANPVYRYRLESSLCVGDSLMFQYELLKTKRLKPSDKNDIGEIVYMPTDNLLSLKPAEVPVKKRR